MSVWPDRDRQAWFDAMDDRTAAANRMWDAVPSTLGGQSGPTWDDVRGECR
ncbi:hypothetical protein [Candidatus Poriferisocius sp.]|uniref:hypothetical protein n=1 Tax=Candidatus Poriferisocius sp. TaxID=3101276 RepID=UPI003B02C12B